MGMKNELGYILVDRKVVKPDTLEEWAAWWDVAHNCSENFEKTYVVKLTIMDVRVEVSTVFLGMNRAFRPTVKPLVFETMIFVNEEPGYVRRYATWEEAEAGHEEVVLQYKNGEIQIND